MTFIRIIFLLIFVFIFLFISCQSKQEEMPTSFQVKGYRYMVGNAYEAGTTDYQLEIQNQGDTLRRYLYFRFDTTYNSRTILMEIEIRNDTAMLMKKGDFVPDVQRILQEKKTFYMGSKEIEVSKFKRAQPTEDMNDAMFMTKEFGIVNMLSYDKKVKILYKFVADKSIGNTINQVNMYLEKDTLGFYYQPTKQ